MTTKSPAAAHSPETDEKARYEELATGVRGDGPRGTVVFVVSTSDLTEGKGDLYVAMGLGKYLNRLGWGVQTWPMGSWGQELPERTSVVITMVDAFIPGFVPPGAVRIAWVRNWTDNWAALPYLRSFDEIWTSSTPSREVLQKNFDGTIRIVPIAGDHELFYPAETASDLAIVTTANGWGSDRELSSAVDALAPGRNVDWYGSVSAATSPRNVRHHGPEDYFTLSSIYNRAQLVLDDLIPAAKAYGNHNSRLFESLLSGALTLVNTADGLEELGLADVPVYSHADELEPLVESLLADDTRRQELAARLRAVVLERHTFEVRANELSPALEALVEQHRTRSERDPILEWSAGERALLIGTQVQRDTETRRADGLTRELALSQRELALSRRELVALRQELSKSEARIVERDERITEILSTTSFQIAVGIQKLASAPRSLRNRLKG
ncbi:glycosyltransferase [Glaciihabitans tibetensis]|uniref:glycosyltransferase family protein n=1 Tax=Glaciihabitans tibetensis TaxID=1266600 RepID=UPI0015E75CB9|nr:glycosyltransferase [Glaciihabitans tibetensis]